MRELASRHAIPNIAVQTPRSIISPTPDNNVFYSCLAGAELQISLTHFIRSVLGNLEIESLESDTHETECTRSLSPKIFNRLPARHNCRIRGEHFRVIGIETSQLRIVLTLQSSAQLPVSLLDRFPYFT